MTEQNRNAHKWTFNFEKSCWQEVTEQETGKPMQRGQLTAGSWDAEKKRWVAKK